MAILNSFPSGVDKTYVDNKVKTDVPANAKFTDTITSINGKTGAISKADIVALGIPAQDTVVDISGKVDKVTGKGLSTEDYTTAEKNKLGGIETGAQKNTVTSVAGKTGAVTLAKGDVGLGNVDNTSDANKPISSATQTALNTKAAASDLTAHTGSTSNPHSVTKSQVGLGSVGNYGRATQAEAEAGTTASKYMTPQRVAQAIAKLQSVKSVAGKTGAVTLSKGDVGLGNVDNTSDANKPISTATQNALNTKAAASDLTAHTGNTSNPHSVTKSQVGLGNVSNVKQMPISGGVLENYMEKLVTLSGTAPAINLNNGNVFTHTLSGNTTYSISNAVNSQAHSFTLLITQGTTARTITFPASVKWQGGEIPDMTTASTIYLLTFLTVNGGTTWLGMFGGEF